MDAAVGWGPYELGHAERTGPGGVVVGTSSLCLSHAVPVLLATGPSSPIAEFSGCRGPFLSLPTARRYSLALPLLTLKGLEWTGHPE